MKLAVRKDTSGTVPLGGYYYSLHPIKLRDDFEANTYELMGYIIITVEDSRGEELLKEAREALNHQINVSVLAEDALKGKV